MKMLKLGFTFTLTLALTACALTPEQQALRQVKQMKAEQELQVRLAQQCDAETADLMHRQFNPPLSQTEQEEKAFKKRYTEKVNDPMFQACYKLAWQHYKSQMELEEMRWNYDRDFMFRGWRYCYSCW